MLALRRRVGSIALAMMLLAPQTWGAGTPVDQATKEQLEAAQRTFEAADVLFDAKRFDEAITAFRASYEIVASPNSRLMIARSLRELRRFDEAWQELEGAIADADAATQIDEKYATTAKAAREDMEKLKAQVARVTLKLVGGSGFGLALDGKQLDPGRLTRPLVLEPGSHTFTAPRADGSPGKLVVDAAAGSEQSVELDLSAGPPALPPAAPTATPEPAAPAPVVSLGSDSPVRTWAYVAGGVGAAGLVTFGVFGLMNNSKFSSLEDDCPGGHCAPNRQDDIDAGRRYQTIANIGLAVGVVGIGAGTALFFMSSPREQRHASGLTDVRVGPGGVSVGGRFR